MIKEAIGFGNTVDEAKENAIGQLNAPEDADIQFDVLETPKKKALGIFGGRQAKVKVSFEVPDPPKARQQREKTRKPAKAQPAAEKKEKTSKNEKAVKNEQEKKEKPQNKPESILSEYGEPVDVAALEADSPAANAVSYLKTILDKLGCTDVAIRVATKENAALILLEGEGLGVVIGRRGETLDSLQYLTSLAANNGNGYYKITINIGDYREKREETLINLANRVAAQVLKTGKSRSLEPMNPYERRVIHTAVQDIEGVVSNSFGEGSSRRVYIALENGDQRPPRRDDRRRGNSSHRSSRKPSSVSPDAPAREPKKDSDTPLYGKIN